MCVAVRTVRAIGELCPCLLWHGFWGGKRKASHTELQSVEHGTHTNTPWLEHTP